MLTLDPNNFADNDSPGVRWLAELFQAVLPLAMFTAPNGSGLAVGAIWIRIKADRMVLVEEGVTYVWDMPENYDTWRHMNDDDYNAEQERGWLIMSIDTVTDGNGENMIRFCKDDFDGEGFRRNMEEVMANLRANAGVPSFTADQVRNVLGSYGIK